MNAYELADKLDRYGEVSSLNKVWQAARMLRQQADRIAELEKVSSKPVLWMNHLHPTDIYKEETIIHNVPLYTHPVKQLSDEEIWDWFKENTALTKESALMIARAIERKITE